MSTESNKQTVRTFFELMGRHDVESAFALLAQDATWWFPTDRVGGMFLTKDDMRNTVDAFTEIFANRPVTELGRITAEENRVCVEQTARGGLTREGAEYGNDYHMLVELRDGLITEIREYMNPLMAAGVMAELQQVQAGAT